LRIIAKRTLKDFYSNSKYKDSKAHLEAWYYEAIHADWNTPADIKAQHRNASIVADNRVVFNICGNKYRLVVKFHYNIGIGYIRFIGTHEQYDQINVETI